MASVTVFNNAAKLSAKYKRLLTTMPQATQRTLARLGLDALNLYAKVTNTWEHQPVFETRNVFTALQVFTNDEIFDWVNFGTQPHVIKAKHGDYLYFRVGGFKPKTKPNVLASYPGAAGQNLIRKRSVNHPGTEARNFSAKINERVMANALKYLKQEIDEELEA